MVKRLNQELGITIIISSHIPSELYLVANFVLDLSIKGVSSKSCLRKNLTEKVATISSLKTDNISVAHLVQDKLGYQIKPTNKEDERIFPAST